MRKSCHPIWAFTRSTQFLRSISPRREPYIVYTALENTKHKCPSGVLLHLIYFTFMILIFFVTYQTILHYIWHSTPQSFTNIYHVITRSKPILTFETADSKTLLIQAGLLLPSSISKHRDPNSAKIVKKNLV